MITSHKHEFAHQNCQHYCVFPIQSSLYFSTITNVGVSVKFPCVEDDFDNLIVDSIACTLDENDGCTKGHESLRFKSLHEAIKEVHEVCREQGKRFLEQAKKVQKRVIGYALNEA